MIHRVGCQCRSGDRRACTSSTDDCSSQRARYDLKRNRVVRRRVIRVDTPGPGQSEVKTLPWRRVPRPTYPMEPITSWRGCESVFFFQE